MHRLFLTVLFLISSPLAAAEVNVAVAANFTTVMRILEPLFEQTTGHELKVSYGSTGKLFAQIAHGAPFHLFLSADKKRPLLAEQKGLAVKNSGFTYAKGKLALWSPQTGLFDNGADFLKQAKFHKIAIANPKTAPYGVAAKQVLEHLQLWSTIRSRLVRGDSIAQTFQFTATANAEAGFIAYAQIKVWKGTEGSFWLIPDEYYQSIEQVAVLLKRGESNPAAAAFMEFLKSERVRNLIRAFGYGV